eukprot:11184586-Lingulodinium_polyedra.AAC.1
MEVGAGVERRFAAFAGVWCRVFARKVDCVGPAHAKKAQASLRVPQHLRRALVAGRGQRHLAFGG